MLDLEIALYWPPKHKLGWVSAFYFLNRYFTLFGYLPFMRDVFVYGNPAIRGEKYCDGITAYHQYFQITIQTLVGVLCMMRIYALYNRSRYMLGFLMAVAIAVIVSGVWVVATFRNRSIQIIASTIPGCIQLLTDADGRHLATGWSGVLVFDTIIFILTLYKGVKLGFRTEKGLLQVLIKDGTVYFTVLFLVNFGNILMLLMAPPILKTSTAALTNILSSTLISRVMLNLRAAPAARRMTGTSSESNAEGAPLTTTFDIELGIERTWSSSGPPSRDGEPHSARHRTFVANRESRVS
ncbi:hypothetical protein FA95DRAFT_88489 [Auriscalpium vulgare]|uniref:Uncharacterized protein n=1 Tax=Auriscalpium vulgare TaxID=40419 RepID=A0ACB8RPK3_9AGAM|nr:hypothetical protein FA95DRAFT_88489 [Auriscalpium vulgare]